VPAAALLALTISKGNIATADQGVVEWALADRVREVSRWFVAGPGLRAWLVITLAVVAAGATLVRARGGNATPTEQAFAWLAFGLFGLTFFAPLHIPGWQCLAPRFALVAMILGLALVRLPARARSHVTRALVPVVTLCCIGSDLVSASLHRDLANGCAEALSGLDAPLHFEGPVLPIILEPYCGTPRDPVEGPIPRASLANNTPLLYLVAHGGIGTKMFNGAPAIHAIEFIGARRPRRLDPRPLRIAQSPYVDADAELRTTVFTELAADGMAFEGIHVLGGRPDDFALFNERGYVTQLQRGSLFIARFEGCPAEILLPAGALNREAVFYDYGLMSRTLLVPEPRSLGTIAVKRDTPAIDGAIHVPLARRPCGDIWVRVFWDADASSSFTPGDRTCENAPWQGRLRAKVSREHATVSCVSPP
jgi:hypothetical protein